MSFEKTIIMNLKTKKFIEELLRKEYFSIKKNELWRDKDCDEIIIHCEQLGWTDLKEELLTYNN